MAQLPDLFTSKRMSNPLREITRLQEEMDRMVNELMGARTEGSLEKFDFSPSCEISEHEKSYEMKFDLPGVKKDQVKVEIDGDRLTVRAERKEEKEEKSKKRHLSEISYGSYMRSFTLPHTIDEKKVDARFEDGVLLVSVPKSESTKAKQISIH